MVDLASGHLNALQGLESPQCYAVNLGTSVGCSVLDVAKTFSEVSGRPVQYEIASPRAGDIAACYAEASFAEKLLQWRAKRNLVAMCADTWRW